MKRIKRIGVLTGGGDCPGLNAVIRAITKAAIFQHGLEVIGILDGFKGLMENQTRKLTADDASGILHRGGTILGTSNRDNPFRVPTQDGRFEDRSDIALQTLSQLKLDVLLCVGGDGTMNVTQQFFEKGVPVVGIPKTIDNDLSGTDQTFGFDTAISIIAESLDRLHTTAASHHRIMVVETMGRYAGWLALAGGMAGGADVILIPEIPYQIDRVLEVFEKRKATGRSFSIVAVAEGAKPQGGTLTVKRRDEKSTDPIRLGGVAKRVACEIEDSGQHETRVVVLGHLQRGGTPTAFDRLLGTRYGVKAVEMAMEEEFGRMAALRGNLIASVALKEAVDSLRLVTLQDPLLKAARCVGTSFGD